MTLDSEVRALEREARARPDDGATQVELAAALARLGRDREAFEALLRAAANDPADPEVARALDGLDWWATPRGSAAGTRAVAAPGARTRPGSAHAWRVGGRPESLALGRGLAFVRVHDERTDDRPGEARLVAVALATGREAWSRDELAVASAPPLVSGDTVYDATLAPADRGLVFKLRARDVATGRERYSVSEPQSGPTSGAIFATAAVHGRWLAYAVAPHGRRVAFDPFLRVFEASTGQVMLREPVGDLADLALDPSGALLAAKFETPWRVEAWRLPGPVRLWEARDDRPVRVVATPRVAVLATEQGLVGVDRATGAERWRGFRRLANPEALVVTPRLVIGSWQRTGTSAVDLVTGSTIWRDASPARMLCASEDVLYAVTGDGTWLRAFDLDSGEPLWTLDLVLALRDQLGPGSLLRIAAAPSRIVGLTRDGLLFVLAV